MNTDSTVAQEREPEEQINFRVPASLKLEIDLAVTRRRTTLRKFCTVAIRRFLGKAEESD